MRNFTICKLIELANNGLDCASAHDAQAMEAHKQKTGSAKPCETTHKMLKQYEHTITALGGLTGWFNILQRAKLAIQGDFLASEFNVFQCKRISTAVCV